MPVEQGKGDHIAVYRSFYEAIVYSSRDYCDGVEGRKPLELANAINYSSYHHREVELPLDRQLYSAFLRDLQRGSKFSFRSV
jgi:hypothetical protein